MAKKTTKPPVKAKAKAKAPAAEKQKAPEATKRTVFTMSPAELAVGAKAFQETVDAAAKTHLPGLRLMDKKGRQRSLGRYRAKEAEALGAALTAASIEPAFFVALAKRDNGSDEKRFEAEPSLEGLARRDALAGVSSSLDDVATALRDTVLTLGHTPRAVALAVYAIGKLAYDAGEGSEEFRSAFASAVDYYAHDASAAPAETPPTK